jgi:protein TonB
LSATALKHFAELSPEGDALSASHAWSKLSATADQLDYSFGLKRLQQLERKSGFLRRDLLILGVLVIVAHVAGVEGYLRSLNDPIIVPEKKREVFVEFIRPEPPPPPKIEEPKPEPPKPKVEKVAPPPKPVPVLKTAPAEPDIKADDMTVQENLQAAPTPGPVVAEPAPPPPAPK